MLLIFTIFKNTFLFVLIALSSVAVVLQLLYLFSKESMHRCNYKDLTLALYTNLAIAVAGSTRLINYFYPVFVVSLDGCVAVLSNRFIIF